VPDPYLFSQRRLFAIINESVAILYNTQNTYMSQANYQEHVARFEARLTMWKLQLPEELGFEKTPSRDIDGVVEREVGIQISS